MHAQEFPLRPLAMGELLDRAFLLYRQNFWKFVGALAVAQVIVTGLETVSIAFNLPDLFSGLIENSFIESIYTIIFRTNNWPLWLNIIKIILLDCLGTAALVYLALNCYFRNPIGILEAYKKVIGYGWKLMGAWVYLELILILTVLFAIIPIVGWLPGPGIILFVLLVVLPMFTIAIVIEGQPLRKAYGRIISLVIKRFWWVVGFMSTIFLINLVVYWVQIVLTNSLTEIILGKDASQIAYGELTLSHLMTQIISMVGGLIGYSFQITALVVMYLDLRVRFEGLDLVLMTEQLSDSPRNLVNSIVCLPSPDATYKLSIKNLWWFTLFGWGYVVTTLSISWLITFYNRIF